MQSTLAALAYMPLGFLLTACWLEVVTALKKNTANQPGVITSLFGAITTGVVALVVSLALPPAGVEASASSLAWPAGVPEWSSVFGVVALALAGLTYGLKIHLRNRANAIAQAPADTPKQHLAKAYKSFKEAQMGYYLLLAAAALLIAFAAFLVEADSPLGQLISFLPLGLLGTVIWLEIVTLFKRNRSNQPAALSALLLTVAFSLIAVVMGIAVALKKGDTTTAESTVAPTWGTPWGVAALAALVFAYLLKLRSHRKALTIPENVSQGIRNPAAQIILKQITSTNRTYTLVVLSALAFLIMAHLKVLGTRDELASAYASAREKVSETTEKIKDFVNLKTGSATLDEYASVEGSIGSLLAASAVQVKEKRDSPETGSPTVETAPDDDASENIFEGSELMADEPVVAVNTTIEQPVSPPALEPTEMTEPTPPAPTPQEEEAPKAAVTTITPYDGGKFFTSRVKPILKSKCYKCHGSEKERSGLRLHAPEKIRAGGDGGSVVLAGNPSRSPLYTSTTLDEDDPDVMPAKGKLLTKTQQRILEKWILEGAHMPGGDISSNLSITKNIGGDYLIDKLAENTPTPNSAVLQALEQEEIQFRALSVNGSFLKVDYSHTPRNRTPDLVQLTPVAQNVYWLDLSRTKISDQDLAPVAKLQNLRKLELNLTGIEDSGMTYLQGLENLETLNLYGTRVSDDGLKLLEGLKKLRKIYLFDTATSKSGGESLKGKIPGLEIVDGNL